MMKADRLITLSVFVLIGIILFLGFYRNFWKVADGSRFTSFQRRSQSLVIGRLVKSRQDGILSAGGLNGAGVSKDLHLEWISSAQAEAQYRAYYNNETFSEYSPYRSQIGGQGMLLGIIDLLLPFNPETRFDLFQFLSALMSALTLAAIVYWFYLELGTFPAMAVAVSMIFSRWLTLMGRNLWWNLWAFYLPMAAVMFALRKQVPDQKTLYRTLFIIGFITIFIKCFINGYEYITTTILMMAVPWLYNSIRAQTGRKNLLRGFLYLIAAALTAVLLSMTILSLQISFLDGDLLAGPRHILFSLGRRTYLDQTPINLLDFSGSSINPIRLMYNYLAGTYINLYNYFGITDPLLVRFILKIRYIYLILIYGITSFILAGLKEPVPPGVQRKKTTALVKACWFSLLAPLSWLLIFISHSYVHNHINFVVWQMPFTIFGSALTGYLLKILIGKMNDRKILKSATRLK